MASGNFLIGSGSNTDMVLGHMYHKLVESGLYITEMHQIHRAELLVQTERGYETLLPNTSVLACVRMKPADPFRLVHDLDADIRSIAEVMKNKGNEYEWIASKLARLETIEDDTPVVYLQTLSVFEDDMKAGDHVPQILEQLVHERRHANSMEYLTKAATIGYIPQD